MQQITITINATSASYTITRQYNNHARREETGILPQVTAELHIAALRKLAHAIAADGRSNPRHQEKKQKANH